MRPLRFFVSITLMLSLVAAVPVTAGASFRDAENLQLWPTPARSIPSQVDFYMAEANVFVDRANSGTRLIDPANGNVIRTIPRSWVYRYPEDSGKLMFCQRQQVAIYDIASDSFDVEIQYSEETNRSNSCALHDGAIWVSWSNSTIFKVDLATKAVTEFAAPEETTLSLLEAGDSTTVPQLYNGRTHTYHNLDIDNPNVLGPVVDRIPSVPYGRSTGFILTNGVLTEVKPDGTVVRSAVVCEEDCSSGAVRQLTNDLVLFKNDRTLFAVDMKLEKVVGSYYIGSSYVTHGDANHFWVTSFAYADTDIIPVKSSIIRSAPSEFDATEGEPMRVGVWSTAAAVWAEVNGSRVPFTQPDSNLYLDMSSAVTRRSTVQIGFADGTVSQKVQLDVLGIEELVTVSITARAAPTTDPARQVLIEMRCSAPGTFYGKHAVYDGLTVTFRVPKHAECRAYSNGARFGPLFDDGSVFDYALRYPDGPIVSDISFGALIGGGTPQWVFADRTGADSGSRPAHLDCRSRGTWSGEIEYGYWTRIRADENCDWTFPAVDGFDHIVVDEFSQDSSLANVYYTGLQAPTVTYVSDLITHPDANASAFANAIMLRSVGRKAAAGELSYWTPLLNADPNQRGELVAGALQLDEYRNRTEPIARMYQAYFDRLPDASGLQYWTELANNGVGLDEISNQFALSQEFKNTYGNADNARFIALAYANVLKRTQDAEGYAYWLGHMNNGMTGPELMLYFSDSEEFRNNMRERLAVTSVYTTLAGRTPTETEVQAGIAELRAGGSVAPLANRLIGTGDYLSSFADHHLE